MENKEKEVLLKVRGAKTYFPIKKGLMKKTVGYVKAVDDISLDVYKGETLGLVGESGCGKTTVGRTILHLYKPTAGEIIFDGKPIKTKADIQEFRKKATMVFQDPYSSLNPRMTVGQIIGEGLTTHKFFKAGDPQMKDYILNVMEQCGLQGYMLHRYPHQFSGGQRQRICIARALAVKPKFIVCDECVSALDVSIQSQIINLLPDLQKKLDLTFLFIAHDLNIVKYISDRIAVMYLGRLIEKAPSEKLFANPSHPYTQALLSAIPLPKLGAKRERIILKGEITSPIEPKPMCRFAPRCIHAKDICFKEEPKMKEIAPGHEVMCHLF